MCLAHKCLRSSYNEPILGETTVRMVPYSNNGSNQVFSVLCFGNIQDKVVQFKAFILKIFETFSQLHSLGIFLCRISKKNFRVNFANPVLKSLLITGFETAVYFKESTPESLLMAKKEMWELGQVIFNQLFELESRELGKDIELTFPFTELFGPQPLSERTALKKLRDEVTFAVGMADQMFSPSPMPAATSEQIKEICRYKKSYMDNTPGWFK